MKDAFYFAIVSSDSLVRFGLVVFDQVIKHCVLFDHPSQSHLWSSGEVISIVIIRKERQLENHIKDWFWRWWPQTISLCFLSDLFLASFAFFQSPHHQCIVGSPHKQLRLCSSSKMARSYVLLPEGLLCLPAVSRVCRKCQETGQCYQ